jgi:type I restriction enzyme M protein
MGQKSGSANQVELFTSGAAGRAITRQLAQPPVYSELEPVPTLIPVFEAIRAFLAANATGMTRDEAILEELTKLLHAKVCDELQGRDGHALRFYALTAERPSQVRDRIRGLYAASLAKQPAADSAGRSITLDEVSCYFAVQALHHRCLQAAGRDVIGEAYETLIFPALRGGQGQFFTPKNVAACLAALVTVSSGQRVIDPACGTGGFLSEMMGVSNGQPQQLVGIDKDELLVRLASDSFALRGLPANFACCNSLVRPDSLPYQVSELLTRETYDVAITNPPFGSKIPVVGDDLLRTYDLAFKWTSHRDGKWRKQSELRDAVPPQILFIELCWKLLREGGRCGIVLPEGILGNQSLGYVRQWLTERTDILAIVDCPLETFMPSTSTKTVLLVFERRAEPRRPPVFMAVAHRCGHDRRGKPLVTEEGLRDDDFPTVASLWQEHTTARRAS